MDILLSGKVALEDEDTIEYLKKRRLAQPIKHHTLSFKHKLSTDKTLDFILNNLK